MSELSREARALMEQGASDGATSHDRERIKARLAAELGAGVFAAATVATAASAHAGAFDALKGASGWLKGITSLAALTGGAAAIYVGLTSPSAPERVDASRAEPPALAAPAAAPDADGEQAVPADMPVAERAVPTAPAVPDEPTVVASRKARRARDDRSSEALGAPSEESARVTAGPAAVPSASDVQAELALLARAQRALREGKAEQALAVAREHARDFESGALSEERAAIEAIATCRLGRGVDAARAFLARAPASPLAARVRKECGSE